MQTTKLIFLAIPILLSGCVAAPLVITGVGAASMVINETTGKTLTDQTVSTVNGKDCRISRMFKDQAVCQDERPEFNLVITTTGVKPSTIEEIQAKYK